MNARSFLADILIALVTDKPTTRALGLLRLLVSCSIFFALPGWSQSQSNRWVASWAAAPDASPISEQQSIGNVTYRETVHLSGGADKVRVVFSNEFGTTRLTIAAAHLAPSEGRDAIDKGKDRELTFSGRTEAVLPPGARLVSDPVSLNVAALSTLAVSFYLPAQNLPVRSVHHLAVQTSYVASGNQVEAPALPAAKEITSWPFLRTVEIEPDTLTSAVVCLGDSITDGHGSSLDANARWPNILADRLAAAPALTSQAVLNDGIAGNRLLQNGTGPNALARLDRDVFSQGNVKYLIVLEGINDIGDGWRSDSADPFPPSADDIIAAYKQIITRAHAHNIAVYGGTLLPFEGAAYYSLAGDSIRMEVNTWIRNAGVFDGVLDFEEIVHDPANPKRLRPAFDSGDHLHPNDAGYKAMADSIPLNLFATPLTPDN